MARPKSYNRDDALQRACSAFWQHGYRSLGVRAIEAETGLNQFAIRSEFGGKEGLFLEALDLYAKHAESLTLVPLKDEGVAGIEQFFDHLIDTTSPTSSKWGCMIVNAGVENAKNGNAKIAAISRHYWRTLEMHFSTALQEAQDHGILHLDLDVADAAKSLVVAVVGIHTINRIEGSQNAGASMVNTVKDLLRSWSR